ncbi:hypothetical protein D9758_001849 [Tetrapyrgos nigripes]|uniref:Uncharacterized protein n=1 Tax=Tetrapyrgos nigripes TaxID=182062 RepID=A0A8H5GTD2_9AGAR|nr:hypothetical protein D9758_001849 [Tetrapyrgos nigripes]
MDSIPASKRRRRHIDTEEGVDARGFLDIEALEDSELGSDDEDEDELLNGNGESWINDEDSEEENQDTSVYRQMDSTPLGSSSKTRPISAREKLKARLDKIKLDYTRPRPCHYSTSQTLPTPDVPLSNRTQAEADAIRATQNDVPD